MDANTRFSPVGPTNSVVHDGPDARVEHARVDGARPMLSFVVPVFNEAETLPHFLTTIRAVLGGLCGDYEIIFCADPCSDGTLELLRAEHHLDSRIKLLVFSRRFGQPAATMAGIHYCSGAAVIVMDCDLQDSPSLIPEMVELWRQGWKVVIPQRTSRKGEHILKRIVAWAGYWFINKVSNVDLPRNTGDFRLLDRVVVDQLKRLKESHGFLRGLTAVVGFRTRLLPFERDERRAGQGKYNRITGSLRIGFNGIICFSDYLLNLMIKVGLILAILAIASAFGVLYLKLVLKWPFASGIPSIMILVLFLGGLNLIGMGVLGTYLGRVYDEVKERPLFIVEENLGCQI